MKPVIGITCDIHDKFYRLRQEYVSAIINAGGLPVILPPVIDTAAHLAGMIDGLLLSGGGDVPPEYYGEDISVPADLLNFVERQRVDFELSLLKEVIKKKKPVFGICLGMQLVNIAFGGSLYQDLGLQISNALDHKKEHGIKIIQNELAGTQLSDCTVNSTHHQAIKKLGDGLEVFAIAEDDIIEGFIKKEYPFLVSVQWHPERSLEPGVESLALEKKERNYDKLSLWLFETFIKKTLAAD